MKRLIKKASNVWVGEPEVRLDEGPSGWEAGAYDVTCMKQGEIKIDALKGIPGANGENRQWHKRDGKEYFGNYSKEEWEEFKNDLEQNGMKYPIFITVDKDGTILMSEGNHRMEAAKQLEWDSVPVEIKYFGNSQQDVHKFD
jgi:hypothetical protein